VRRYLFSALFLLTTLVSAKNMWETHGHDFSYSPSGSGEQKVMFPVAGDVNSAVVLWQGTGTGSIIQTSLVKGAYPAGLYFVILTGDHTLLTGKCFLW
jgi:hypothetical protein